MNSTVIENLREAVVQLRDAEANAAKAGSRNPEDSLLKKSAIEIGHLQADINSVKIRLEALLHVIKLNTNEG